MNDETLPVYKATFELLLTVYRLTVNMQREYRYTLADELKRALQDLLVIIYRANISTDKLAVIGLAREQVVKVKVLFHLMAELHLYTSKQEARLTIQIGDISKQLSLWERYCKEHLKT